ncbi:CYTH domain-containing protein [Candidatus Gracilibacteria bacterium]|nr:CYTH domain-containing protein [Candidatus Gracilibacteria bacterium]
MEIEAKFCVQDKQIFRQLLALRALGEYTFIAPTHYERLHTIYYDTDDNLLTAYGYNVRIRTSGKERTATVKRGLRSYGGIHERDEWEIGIGDVVQPQEWPASIARDLACTLVGERLLRPLFKVSMWRWTLHVYSRERRIAHASLDLGLIVANGERCRLRELEIELVDKGTRSDLAQLFMLVTTMFPIFAEPRSKRARGMELLSRSQSR